MEGAFTPPVRTEEEEEMNFIETHDSYKKLLQNNAYTIMGFYILYNTTCNIIIIMVIRR